MAPSPAEDEKNPQIVEEKEVVSDKLYPARRGEYHTSLTRKLLLGEGRVLTDRFKCERRVCEVLDKSPLVKLMISALHSAGCDFDVRRHISCEPCDTSVIGGYDPELNQVVICQNVAKSAGRVQSALSHELVHMFDYCRANLDFKNVDHLACTEIRAANMFHCSFLGAVVEGSVSPFNIRKQHGECVKNKAIASILGVRNISREMASQAVERVFDKCYKDLEPVGRRIRRNSMDMEKAYRERYYYGYYDP